MKEGGKEEECSHSDKVNPKEKKTKSLSYLYTKYHQAYHCDTSSLFFKLWCDRDVILLEER